MTTVLCAIGACAFTCLLGYMWGYEDGRNKAGDD